MIFAMGRVTSGGSSIAAFVFDRQKGAFMVWLILLIAAVVLAPVLVGIIGNIESEIFVSGMHGQGLIMHVAGDPRRRHFGYNLVSLLVCNAGNPRDI